MLNAIGGHAKSEPDVLLDNYALLAAPLSCACQDRLHSGFGFNARHSLAERKFVMGKDRLSSPADTSVRVSGNTAAGLAQLSEAWRAPSQKATLAAMVDFFTERHINPLDEKPMSVAEQLSKLRDTVIGFHKNAEKKQTEQIVRQLAKLRVIAEQAHGISRQAISQKDFQEQSTKTLQNDNVIYQEVKKNQEVLVTLIGSRVGRGEEIQALKEKLRKGCAQTFDELVSSRNAMGVISKEKLKELETGLFSTIEKL